MSTLDAWEAWLMLTCVLLIAVWAASAWSGWYVARRRRHMREVFRHRPEVRCERAGSQAEFYRRAR